ncbi:MAG TPA: hypothetical protein VMV02_05020 [Acidimicrobiales bacterium]|nr:hypothetical protein [Acidimicrobiales bacterium]
MSWQVTMTARAISERAGAISERAGAREVEGKLLLRTGRDGGGDVRRAMGTAPVVSGGPSV